VTVPAAALLILSLEAPRTEGNEGKRQPSGCGF
jgi:hypothetical protein